MQVRDVLNSRLTQKEALITRAVTKFSKAHRKIAF